MKKTFFRLCAGPLNGRTLCPGTAEHHRAIVAGGTAAGQFALRAEETSSADDASNWQEPAADVEHIYEPCDRIDEIWLEIVLCKYVGSRAAPVRREQLVAAR